MPLTLPNLDDLRWDDLVEEGRSLIPAYAPEWTNHNPSDPGMTLIELFAYASERLMYQTNRVTQQHMLEFLKLINGHQLEDKSQHDLSAAKRNAVLALRDSTRAVTVEDFEELARHVKGVSEGDDKGRAICIPGSNLESEDPAEKVATAPGHVTVIIIPGKKAHPSRELLVKVKEALEPARLLTTRIHVIGPKYVNLGLRVTLVLQRGTPIEPIKDEVIKRIREFFDPLTGWIDRKGWPLGRSVYVSELYQLLGDIEGIELAKRSKDAAGVAMDEFVLTSPQPERMKRDSRGELEAVQLHPHELINVTVGRDNISVSFQS